MWKSDFARISEKDKEHHRASVKKNANFCCHKYIYSNCNIMGFCSLEAGLQQCKLTCCESVTQRIQVNLFVFSG